MACTNFAAEKVSVDASSKNMNEKDEGKISAVGWVKENCILHDICSSKLVAQDGL